MVDRYKAAVPDTLDLAERASLAINALTQTADPDNNYESYQCGHLDHRPPHMNHRWAGPCLAKPFEAIPMMRIMSGSSQNPGVEAKMGEGLVRDIEKDGLWWMKVAGRPWRADTFGEDQVWPVAHARLMLALLTWYEIDRDSKWLEIVQRMADGLGSIAVHREDRAYFHTAYMRSGWPTSEGESEPSDTAAYNIGLPIRALSSWYSISGDKKAVALAEQLVRFFLKPSMWCTTEGPTMVAGVEHALWEGHFHTYTMGVMGLLEYAVAVNDTRLLRFVRDFYEHGRKFGIARIGFFPAVIGPLSKVRALNELEKAPEKIRPQVDEGCAVADMIWLALRLSDAGIGDYWDDVDQYVRNHLVEHQLIRRDLIEAIVAVGPEHSLDPSMETDDRVIERNIGAFASGSDPTMLYAWWTMCCVGNCSVALYEAWESIVRCAGGTAQVNLLLNRASPWLDVDSYLPYEGKVVIKNKAARRVQVRIPVWVDKKAVRTSVDGKDTAHTWLNNYLIFDGIGERSEITVDFPMVETVENWTEITYDQQYRCRFKGGTLIDISPRAERPAWTDMSSDDGTLFTVSRGYPIYLRDFYDRNTAPMKEIVRYVSPAFGADQS